MLNRPTRRIFAKSAPFTLIAGRSCLVVGALLAMVGCAADTDATFPDENADRTGLEATDDGSVTELGSVDEATDTGLAPEAGAEQAAAGSVVGSWATCDGVVELAEDGSFTFARHALTSVVACEKRGTYTVEDGVFSVNVVTDDCEDPGSGSFNVVVRDDYLVLIEDSGAPIVAVSTRLEQRAWRVTTRTERVSGETSIITTYGDPQNPTLGCYAPVAGRACVDPGCTGEAREVVFTTAGAFEAVLAAPSDDCTIVTELSGELDASGRYRGTFSSDQCTDVHVGSFVAEVAEL